MNSLSFNGYKFKFIMFVYGSGSVTSEVIYFNSFEEFKASYDDMSELYWSSDWNNVLFSICLLSVKGPNFSTVIREWYNLRPAHYFYNFIARNSYD